ncbi:MAG: RHS repeat-associated core domain-containing protein, partial [Bacteroidales bacterium]|nr:RHS repeat-associated core domain-containing protein [Bacteroidales bacterium]
KPFMVCGFLGVFWNLSYGPEDHLGSTRMVLNENGEVKEALMYQPYGTVSDVQGISGSRTDPLRQKFTTKEFDEEGDENGAPGIDAYHFGFRVYDPEIGIFLSPDPEMEFFNLYSYTDGNPINRIDPFGLATETIIFTVAEVPIIYASEILESLFAAGIMVTESWYINGATDKLTSFPADELNSDMSHSTAGENIEKINSEIDVQLRRSIDAVALSFAATGSGLAQGGAGTGETAGRLSKQLANTKTSQALSNATENSVLQVTENGVVLPKSTKIPKDLVQNPFNRPGSYGKIDPATGKFAEKLRVDAPTPKGMKGPDFSHFHVNGSGKHLTNLTKWPK